jgi:hypothetical protein
MMNKLLITTIMLMLVIPGFAQFTAVNYDTGKQWFNEGQPLPAEVALVFKGLLPQEVDRLEIQILSSKRDYLYGAVGKRQDNNEFAIPVNYKLRASERYDFQIDFFQRLPESEKAVLKGEILKTMDTYIDVNLSGEKSIKLLKNPHRTVKEMNAIVADILRIYRSKIAGWDREFSAVVQLKLEQLDDAKLGANYSKSDTSTTLQTTRANTRAKLISQLKEQVGQEINQMLGVEMLVLRETQIVDDYPTEPKENSLSINVGYGGVYLSGDLNDLTYGSAPYVGLAFPLGNSVLGSNFLSNSSVTIGFFLDNFEDEKGNEITGFLVNRPIYLGLDHKLFKFLRINAGGVFLEEAVSGGSSNRDVLIRPYVGLSARIDLSIGLGK